MNRADLELLLKPLSLLLFALPILITQMWFTAELQTTPMVLISVTLGVIIFAMFAFFCLLLIKPEKYKRYILMNIVSIIFISLLFFALPTTALSDYLEDTLIEYYGLEDVMGFGGGIPIKYNFPIDNDGTIDTEQISSNYSGLRIKYLQGGITEDDELVGKKVIIVYEGDKFSPFNTMTAFELDDDFDTTRSAKDQGYRGRSYPIIDVLVSPE
jgi:hypothetical protein